MSLAQSAETGTTRMIDDEIGKIERILAKDLFFIAATEKSGTTWLQSLIDAHPSAACRGEGQFFTQLSPKLATATNEYQAFVKRLNTTVFDETAGFPLMGRAEFRFLARSAAALMMAGYGDAPEITAVGEKTPGTVRALGHMRELFPDAKVLFILRDGRDAAVSGWIHLVRQWGPKKGTEALDHYAKRFAKIWRKDYEAARVFADAHPADFLEIRYEALHADPAREMSHVFEFLGLARDEATLAQCIEAASFGSLSGGRERGQEDRASQFRKGIVGDWRNHFDQAATDAFEAEAGDLLRQLGYADEPAREAGR